MPTAAAPASKAITAVEHCDLGMADAAARNRDGLETLAIAPYRRAEAGWAAYGPLVASTIRTRCSPGSPGFASRLSAWQSVHRLPPTGVIGAPEMQALMLVWQRERPFAVASAGKCPDPPAESRLTTVPAAYAYGGKVMLIRPGALAAYEKMLGAARTEQPAFAADHQLLMIFSAYRSPAADAARCALENNCQNLVRAACSAHLTGLAMDLDLGSAPGMRFDSSDDANRRAIVQGPAYLWMAANAHRFGFVPYPFEPWHWEWTGEPVETP